MGAMTSTTTRARAEGGSFASEVPRTVRTLGDVSFLNREGKSTLSRRVGEVTTGPSENPQIRVPRVLPPEKGARFGFILLQKWDGSVLECDNETFTAKLLDTYGELEPHNATFSRSELLPDEQLLIEPGASFVWTLGYRQIGSTRERTSVLYFRRLPAWSESEIALAQERATALRQTIDWH